MIGGLQKVTLLDFQGKVACTVFLTGCNLRCPYCHNPELVLPQNNGKPVSENELFDFLFSRKGKLDGICITGGEPTLAENYERPYYTLSPTYSICADHGYLAGEQAVCPHCGRKTEVYSRITGYYRPVQNWNDGKSQEFRDRKTYHIGEIKNEAKPENKTSSVCDADGYILYTTSTCPNCRAVKPLLEKSGLCYTERDVDEYIEEATALGLRQAPTLAVQSGDKTVLYPGVAQIKALLKGLAL